MAIHSPRAVPYEVAQDGGFPTEEEFGRAWTALADAHEFGIERLVKRIAAPIVGAYEANEPLDWRYENVGVLATKAADLSEMAEFIFDAAKNLQALVREVGEIVAYDGKVEVTPRFSRYGTEGHTPSQEYLERLGLARVAAA